MTTTRVHPLTASVAHVVVEDDQDRVNALQAALRWADRALTNPADESLREAALHEVRVALTLERGDA